MEIRLCVATNSQLEKVYFENRHSKFLLPGLEHRPPAPLEQRKYGTTEATK